MSSNLERCTKLCSRTRGAPARDQADALVELVSKALESLASRLHPQISGATHP
jgi:hypothetical protein